MIAFNSPHTAKAVASQSLCRRGYSEAGIAAMERIGEEGASGMGGLLIPKYI